jgi:hypothetical protein
MIKNIFTGEEIPVKIKISYCIDKIIKNNGEKYYEVLFEHLDYWGILTPKHFSSFGAAAVWFKNWEANKVKEVKTISTF